MLPPCNEIKVSEINLATKEGRLHPLVELEREERDRELCMGNKASSSISLSTGFVKASSIHTAKQDKLKSSKSQTTDYFEGFRSASTLLTKPQSSLLPDLPDQANCPSSIEETCTGTCRSFLEEKSEGEMVHQKKEEGSRERLKKKHVTFGDLMHSHESGDDLVYEGSSVVGVVSKAADKNTDCSNMSTAESHTRKRLGSDTCKDVSHKKLKLETTAQE